MLEKKRNIHFVGIGGVGMSSLALVLATLGHRVTGCDISQSKYTQILEKKGITVYYGHSKKHLEKEKPEIVVYSSAVSLENVELLKAKEMGLWVIPRAQMLSQVMNLYPKSIVVAGSHGKTTTTSMIAEILIALKKNPTVIVGGIIKNINSHSVLGKSEFLVAEADESDGSFLCYNPFIEVITNIDKEHLDFYADFSAVKKAFINFIKRCSTQGRVILCGDDQGVQDISKEIFGPFLFYGFLEKNFLKGKVLEDTAYPLVEIYKEDKPLGKVRLGVPGTHNVLNALGAIGVALELNLPIAKVLEVLENFKGVGRRLEFKGEWEGCYLLDDYAHHPKEVKVTLSTLRKMYFDKTLLLVFQPHRYTRVKALWEDFLSVLKEPDILILTEIYPASEAPLPGISGRTLFESVNSLRSNKPTFFAKDLQNALEILKKIVEPGQVIVTMGAGDIYKLHNLLKK